MGGTNGHNEPMWHRPDKAAIPAPVASVRLGGIGAFSCVDDEEDPVLVVSDGETTVEFGCGLSGRSGEAALGAQRLAEAIYEYASAIEANLVVAGHGSGGS